MNRFYCWLKTVWYSLPNMLRGSYPIEGHAYKETFNDGNIQVLECMDCKNVSVAWYEHKDIYETTK